MIRYAGSIVLTKNPVVLEIIELVHAVVLGFCGHA